MKTLFLLAALFSAHADEKPPVLDLGVGTERETLRATAPGGETGEDGSRSGKRLVLKFAAPGYKFLRFVPLEITLDKEERADGFSQLEGIDPESPQNKPTRLRRLKGLLVEGIYERSVFQARGKLLSFDYDRDRGLWDVRWADAEVAIAGAPLKNKKGTVRLKLEARAGAAVGRTRLMAFDDLTRQLDFENAGASTIPVAIPHAGASIIFRSPHATLKMRSDVEKRIDLSGDEKRARFLGATSDASSERLVSEFDAEIPFYRNRFSIYGNVTHSLDNLTLGNLLFRTGDTFESLMLTGGLRGRY